MINRNKMSNYARSTIFPEPDPLYGLNRRSSFKLIKFFRLSELLNDRGLSRTSYPKRRFSLDIRSYSWNEYDRALDDLVTKEIEPFSWSDNVFYTTLNNYSYFTARRKRYNDIKPGKE